MANEYTEFPVQPLKSQVCEFCHGVFKSERGVKTHYHACRERVELKASYPVSSATVDFPFAESEISEHNYVEETNPSQITGSERWPILPQHRCIEISSVTIPAHGCGTNLPRCIKHEELERFKMQFREVYETGEEIPLRSRRAILENNS